MWCRLCLHSWFLGFLTLPRIDKVRSCLPNAVNFCISYLTSEFVGLCLPLSLKKEKTPVTYFFQESIWGRWRAVLFISKVVASQHPDMATHSCWTTSLSLRANKSLETSAQNWEKAAAEKQIQGTYHTKCCSRISTLAFWVTSRFGTSNS